MEGVPGAQDPGFTTRGATAALALSLHRWWTCHLWGLWPTGNCLQAGNSIFLWCQRAARLSELAASCPSHQHNGNYRSILGRSFAGIRETWRRCLHGDTWTLLPSQSKMMSSGHTKAEQHILFHYQTTSASSKFGKFPATRTLTSLQLATFWKTIVSTPLCSSPVRTEKGDRFSVDPAEQGCMCFSIILEISSERADNAWSILNTASEDEIIFGVNEINKQY